MLVIDQILPIYSIMEGVESHVRFLWRDHYITLTDHSVNNEYVTFNEEDEKEAGYS